MTEDLVLVGELEPALPAALDPATPNPSRYRDAFAWALPASRALPKDQLAPLNVDLRDAVITVIGAVPAILSFRPRLATLPDFELACVDTLERHATATGQAHALYLGACSGPRRVAELAEQARAWRRLFVQDMTLLITRRLLSAEPLPKLRAQAGYKDRPFNLLSLTDIYCEHWSRIEGHSTIRKAEVEAAQRTSEELIAAFGKRGELTNDVKAANEQRQRNFTLLMHAYDEVRAGLQYLRRNERDWETIAPSIYRGHGGSRRRTAAQPASSTDDGSASASAQRWLIE